MKILEEDNYGWKIERAQQYEQDPDMVKFLLEMAGSDRREVKKRLRIMFAHMLKYQYQPTEQTGKWNNSILGSRNEIEDIFEESPTLYNIYLDEDFCSKSYSRSVEIAVNDTGMSFDDFPKEFPWNPKTVWTKEFIDNFLQLHYLSKPTPKKKKYKE